MIDDVGALAAIIRGAMEILVKIVNTSAKGVGFSLRIFHNNLILSFQVIAQ
ncbi:MAG: hypothetical protein HYY67_03415 [Thaumarchaeota archaeon]|nr:hypothetical protein [Nitrososphaerota archaeon]